MVDSCFNYSVADRLIKYKRVYLRMPRQRNCSNLISIIKPVDQFDITFKWQEMKQLINCLNASIYNYRPRTTLFHAFSQTNYPYSILLYNCNLIASDCALQVNVIYPSISEYQDTPTSKLNKSTKLLINNSPKCDSVCIT